MEWINLIGFGVLVWRLVSLERGIQKDLHFARVSLEKITEFTAQTSSRIGDIAHLYRNQIPRNPQIVELNNEITSIRSSLSLITDKLYEIREGNQASNYGWHLDQILFSLGEIQKSVEDPPMPL